jgi:voltage-gated sodium channel
MRAVSEPTGTFSARFARIANAERFQNAIIGVIVLNAIVLGVETFDGAMERFGDELELANRIFFAIFVAELAIRILAFGTRPQRFFRSGWNVFDFAIIAALVIPGVRENAALLRILRLLRVARLLKFLPDVRVLLRGAQRAIRPATGLAVLTGLLVFVYGMVGWTLFAEVDPVNWGNVGLSMLTLFSILTLEGWNSLFATVFAERPLESLLFFLSFILVGTFVVLNLLLGIMIGSLEEVREEERIRQGGETADVEGRIRDLREALDAVEHSLRVQAERRDRGG